MAMVTNKDRYGNKVPVEVMLKKFKRQIEKEELFLELKKREYFVPKSQARREKSARHQQLMRKLGR